MINAAQILGYDKISAGGANQTVQLTIALCTGPLIMDRRHTESVGAEKCLPGMNITMEIL